MAASATKTSSVQALEALGVEVNVEPGRAKFTEAKLSGEPSSDRRITLAASGLVLRERLQRVPVEQAAASAGEIADGAYNIVITHALLTPAGDVAASTDGRLRIKAGSHRHELLLTGERLGAMTEVEIKDEIQRQREVAAYQADLFFSGMEKADRLLGPRLGA